MDGRIRALVEAIHSTPTQAVLYVSGGASQALGWLLSVPGASSTVLEAVVPYSKISMVQLLGKIPTQFTSQQAVEEMALLAYNRALKLARPGSPVLGLGFTGSLASSQPKRGDHRRLDLLHLNNIEVNRVVIPVMNQSNYVFYLSTRTSNRLWVSNVTLSKGLRTREQEDRISSHILLEAMAGACKVSATYVSELTESEVPDEHERLFDEDEELQELIDGKICMKVYPFSSEAYSSNSERKIILSGSFNPLHDGHIKLLEVASSMCHDGLPCFEISAINADKPPLTIAQIKDRVKQFEKIGMTVIVSTQPFFYKKAELFPGSAFVIGSDTAARLINPKYYGGDRTKMMEILVSCKRIGCTFLVGGRNVDGVFKVLEDLDVPEELRDMFISIPQDRFRMDISSTEIRKKWSS